MNEEEDSTIEALDRARELSEVPVTLEMLEQLGIAKSRGCSQGKFKDYRVASGASPGT